MAETPICVRINVREWFPPDDEIATAVARLCILREDFYLAGLGLAAESIPALDENGALWRKLYFLRKISVALMEAKGALMVLNKNREFRRTMEAENFRREVLDFENSLNAPELENLRNSLGGHVNHNAVQSALRRIDTSVEGTMQVGPSHKETHLGFTANIVEVMLFPDPDNTQLASGTVPKLLSAFDRVIVAYCELKNL